MAAPPPADPAAELEEGRYLERHIGIGAAERLLELVRQLGDDAEQVFVDEVQAPSELLVHRRLLEAQLAAQPQQLDLGPYAVDQRAALPGRPAWRLEIHQSPVDAAVLFPHPHPPGLGRGGRAAPLPGQARAQGAALLPPTARPR